MPSDKLKNRLQEILSLADVRIGGDRPWDIAVRHDGLYARVLGEGSLGLGESYTDGWWDCPALDEFFYRVLSSDLERKVRFTWRDIVPGLAAWLWNRQSRARAPQVARRHYDLGNDLYRLMLDKRMVYSCGNWERARTLDEAQEAKLEFACQKLALRPGMQVLDIGCGWASFARYAAQRFGASVIGITLSQEQAELGRELCADLPVELRLQDYREVSGHFDRLVSIGMFEHVGYKNYRTFMERARVLLPRGGLFYLGTIGGNESVRRCDPWIEKYIFPNSMLPSARQIGAAIEGLFSVELWQNWREYYDKTLMAWYHNFQQNWGQLRSLYGERFYRMWKYYLLASAGAFRAGKTQVWQILLAPLGEHAG